MTMKELPPALREVIAILTQECRNSVKLPLPKGDIYCNATVDDFGGCFNYTRAGETQMIECQAFFNKKGNVYKTCSMEGKWLKTNYQDCRESDVDDSVNQPVYVFLGGYTVSIVLLCISLIIFFYFPQLRCGRITIHKNLFISYVLTGISWIFYFSLVTFQGEILIQNPIWCQVLHVITHFFMGCNFSWMFCEGFYLHTLLLKALSTGRKLLIICYFLGWAFPVLPTAVYTVLRSTDRYQNTQCWTHYSFYVWIIYGPIVASLIFNIVFLINIVRLLMTKLRQVPEAAQTKKAAKATFILIPLLGLHNLLLPVRPDEESSIGLFYIYFSALSLSLQGSFVAIIYCFCNAEVMAIVRRKWNQHMLMKGSDVRTGKLQVTTYSLTEHINTNNIKPTIQKKYAVFQYADFSEKKKRKRSKSTSNGTVL